MEEVVKQTSFDMALDVFYSYLIDEHGLEFSKEDADKKVTPALQKFRDELRSQMGCEEYIASHTEKDAESSSSDFIRTSNRSRK